MKPGGLLHLVWGNIRANRFSTGITVLLAAVSLALSLSTLSLRSQAREAFLNGSGGYDAVLGPPGSSLQLVLNSLFHLETSPGNIPWKLYQSVKQMPGVKLAYPIVVGDSYRGFRVVGTVPELLTEPPSKAVRLPLAEGAMFDPKRREAVLGSEAARATGLRLGDTFQPSHGLDTGGHSHAQEYLVVGVLAASNTPVDRVLWIPLEGVLRMDGHVLREHNHDHEYHPRPGEAIPEEYLQVSAVLLELDSPQRGMTLSKNFQQEKATLAFPVAREVAQIFERLGWAHRLLSLFALAMVVISAGAILASLTVASELRRKDYALLRTLGLPRSGLARLLVTEGLLTVGLGALLSLPLSVAFSSVASQWVRTATGLSLNISRFASETPWVIGFALLLGAFAGAVPGWRVYRSELSQQIDPQAGD